MATPQHVDRDTFLTLLRESGLLTPRQLADVTDQLPATPRGRVIARTLVRMGLLTRFQAEQLLAGRSFGFFLGQYRILEELGKGGMGRVFKAMHQTMNRVVALKVLVPQYGSTAKAQRLFTREMQAVARLAHPNIVTAYDAGWIENRSYLVMEYVDGPNLDQLVRRHGPLPVGQACTFIRQVALGLQCAHEKGMVHRDIKPANLLVAADGAGGCTVKILDFGLARLHDPQSGEAEDGHSLLSRENVVMGTPDFVSPEQARNLSAVDIRSDLYSLGCTFYYLLTGKVPFVGGTVMEKLICHATEEPPAVGKHRPEVPPLVAALVHRLLVKSPAARFQTPAELADALEPFAEGTAFTLPTAPLSTSAESTDSDLDLTDEPAGAEAVAGLIGTLPPDLSLTVRSTELPPRLQPRSQRGAERHRRVLTALTIAVGVVGGVIALVGLLWTR